MNLRLKLVMGGIILIAALASAFAWHSHHQQRYRMVNVGGDSSQCECSKRIER